MCWELSDKCGACSAATAAAMSCWWMHARERGVRQIGPAADLGRREKPLSETPKPCRSRSVMSLGVQPSCSMSVIDPQRARFCSSCDSVSSEANGSTCT